MPSELESALARHRAALLRSERDAALAMVRVYGAGWTRLDRELQAVWGALAEDAQAPAWRTRQVERLMALRAQVEDELRRFEPVAATAIEGQQAVAVEMAHAHAREATWAALGPGPRAEVLAQFNRLPRGAVETLVGYAADGSPLSELARSIGGGVGQNVIDALATGIIGGANPRVTARLMREAYGVGLARALTISRTETLRAYRGATQATYQANQDVVVGWTWVASLSQRTCISCWMMHGTVHGLEETLDDHPNGRCTMAPRTRGWAALGYPGVPDGRPLIEPGPAVFMRQPAAVQRRVLGPAAFEAWQDGALRLEEMVGRRYDPRWGTMRTARSLRAVIGPEAARRYVSVALSRGAATASRSTAFYRELRRARAAEVRAMSPTALAQVREAMGRAEGLPKLGEHFRKHGATLGAQTPEEMNRLFLEHIARRDVRVFTYISTQPTAYRHWAVVGMDNGVAAIYNETKQQHWSFWRQPNVDQFLVKQRDWWIEVVDWDNKPKVKR